MPDWSSWDPSNWGLDGDFTAMVNASILSSRYTAQAWAGGKGLCRVKPWLDEITGTLSYKIVTGPEDPKVFRLPVNHFGTPGSDSSDGNNGAPSKSTDM